MRLLTHTEWDSTLVCTFCIMTIKIVIQIFLTWPMMYNQCERLKLAN